MLTNPRHTDMNTSRLYPLVSTLAVGAAVGLLLAHPAQAADGAARVATDFVRSEFLPTLAALAGAAVREPLAWAALGLGALGWALTGAAS
ncbi:MAG TPA: hypothetical protein VFQ20_09205 [Burkholderiaceae bacterium]|nr:hypothetical protein [Burkholderiaceae bacterium]